MIKRLVRRILGILGGNPSAHYEVIETTEGADGWRSPDIAERQHHEFRHQLRELRAGRPRIDLRTAAEAVRASSIANPHVLEIGCGSGYYSEILRTLAGPSRYTGIDYSPAMIRVARGAYPRENFAVADAARLPFGAGAFDVAMSGNSLMHIPDYAASIREMARVARSWCVFHSVPVLEKRATVRMRKQAYGVEVFELTFNRGELESLFAEAGLAIRDARETFPYDLAGVVGEPTRLLTYACEKRS